MNVKHTIVKHLLKNKPMTLDSLVEYLMQEFKLSEKSARQEYNIALANYPISHGKLNNSQVVVWHLNHEREAWRVFFDAGYIKRDLSAGDLRRLTALYKQRMIPELVFGRVRAYLRRGRLAPALKFIYERGGITQGVLAKHGVQRYDEKFLIAASYLRLNGNKYEVTDDGVKYFEEVLGAA